jgi:hypothetical protein
MKAGYWVAWCPWYESYEVVVVMLGGELFMMVGDDSPISINAEGWEFIKPFDPEDIVLNKEI